MKTPQCSWQRGLCAWLTVLYFPAVIDLCCKLISVCKDDITAEIKHLGVRPSPREPD